MPTIFSNCKECCFIEVLGLDNNINNLYLDDLKKCQIINKKLPNELAIKIIKMSKSYNHCGRCNIKLCNNHFNRAIKWGEYYNTNGALCNQCCWWEIS